MGGKKKNGRMRLNNPVGREVALVKKTYLVRMEIDEQRIADIFERLAQAQQEIWNCYRELEALGIVELKSTASGN